MRNRIYFSLLGVSAGLFFILFIVLSFHNRLAADDFYYAGCYSEKGIWKCMCDLYFGYSARWSSYLFTGWIISLNAFKYFHFVFNCITLCALAAAVYFLIKNIFFYGLKIKLSANLNILYTIVLMCSLFFSSFSIAETWFWLVQVCTYLWSIIMSLVLLNILISQRNSAIHYLIIIICSVFIGGASESYTLINIFLLSSYLVLYAAGNKKKIPTPYPVNNNRNKKIILALIFLLISFTVTMVAPGNEIRYSALPRVSFIETIWIQVKSFIKIVFIKTPLKLHYLVLFSIPWLAVGKYYSDSVKKKKLIPFLFLLKKYFFGILILIFIFLIPTSFVMSELGPDRALSQVSFLITFSFAALFFLTGYNAEIHNKGYQVLKISTAILSIGVLTYHLAEQFSVTKKYANAFDQRVKLLTELNQSGQKNIIELKPLPPPGMIYSAEISEDTSYFTNKFFEYALHLKYGVRKKSNTP